MKKNNEDSQKKQFINMMKKAKKLRKIVTLREEDQIRSDDVVQMRFEYKKTHNKPNKKGQKTK